MTPSHRIATTGIGAACAVLALFGCERPRAPSAGSADGPHVAARAPRPPQAEPGASSPSQNPAVHGEVRSALGTNLGEFEDYTTEWPTVDAFKKSRPWISGSEGTWDDGRPLDTDASGWLRSLAPGQIARTLMFWQDHSIYPAGDYVVTYDGQGTLDFHGTAEVVTSRPGRYRLRVDQPKDGLALFVTAVDPHDPLRNVRVAMPGGACEKDRFRACKLDADCGGSGACALFESHREEVFHPDFLNSLRPYGVIRFVNWMVANKSVERTWNDRPKPTDARFTTRGVPVEVMVALTNELGDDPWFTLPIAADDEYVRKFAEYVRDNSKSRKIYVELSNEVWNPSFPQAAFAEAEGRKRHLSDDPTLARLRWYSERSVETFRIFEDVFGGTSRLVRVLASHAANPWVSETVLSEGDAARHTDALAIAPYFGVDLGTEREALRVEKLSLDALMSELEGPAVDRAAEWISNQADVARRFGVELVAYEGGQHLVGVGPLMNDEKLNALFDAANRDRRMKGVYLRYLRAWREKGGGLFVHYTNVGSYSKFGRWGALERPDEARELAPKFDALCTYGESRTERSP